MNKNFLDQKGFLQFTKNLSVVSYLPFLIFSYWVYYFLPGLYLLCGIKWNDIKWVQGVYVWKLNLRVLPSYRWNIGDQVKILRQHFLSTIKIQWNFEPMDQKVVCKRFVDTYMLSLLSRQWLWKWIFTLSSSWVPFFSSIHDNLVCVKISLSRFRPKTTNVHAY